jgi:hypothetical protein
MMLVCLEQIEEQRHCVYRVVDPEGVPLYLGLFETQVAAERWLERHGYQLIGDTLDTRDSRDTNRRKRVWAKAGTGFSEDSTQGVSDNAKKPVPLNTADRFF